MMKPSILDGEQVIKTLGKVGLEVLRQKGSHVYLKHSDGRATVVPVRKGETIRKGLLIKILKGV
ncbi:MAG: type II toxin-antitoxin system HicA family toxin [Dehalococcoidales bacterium]